MQQLEPSPELFGRIINQIQLEQQLLLLKRRLFWYTLSLTGTLGIFTLALFNFILQANQTGFLTLLNLLYSDFSIIMSHASDYFLSLIESVPIISTAIVSALLLTVFISIIKFAKNLYAIRRIYKIRAI